MNHTPSPFLSRPRAAFAAALATPALAFAQFSTGFDAAADYTDNFDARFTVGAEAPTLFTYGANSGVNGGGGLTSANTAGGTALYNAASFDLASAPLTFSIFFRTLATTGGTVANPAAVLGVSGILDNNAFFGANTANVYLAGRVQYTSTGGATDGGYTFGYLGKNSGTGTVTAASVGTEFTLGDATWFKFTFTLERGATANSFDLGYAVESYGTSGVDTPVSIASETVTVTNAALSQIYGDSSVFAGFRAGSAANAGLDNFSVAPIPEPSAFAALAGLCALGLVATRRRRITIKTPANQSVGLAIQAIPGSLAAD